MSAEEPSRAQAMTNAVIELIDSLDPDQRAAISFPFSGSGSGSGSGSAAGSDERTTWFYTPTDHGGLPLAAMESRQHRLVHRLLATGLSTAGYVTTAVILGQENVLDHLEGFGVDFGRDRGRDPMLYWVAVFGTPGDGRGWGWRFGGHHVSLNYTVLGGGAADAGQVVSATPLFLGADPAAAPLLGPHLHRPLGGAEDLGRDLVRSLDDGQRRTAVVAGVPPLDLVSANRTGLRDGDRPIDLHLIWRGRFEEQLDQQLQQMQRDGEASLGLADADLEAVAFSTAPKGLAVSAMSDEQRTQVHDLLATYVDRIPDDLAQEQWDRVEAGGLDQLHFVWAGSTEPGLPHYFRLQGGDLFVEYDNVARAGNHVHTVWRDLSLDFGGDALAAHYAVGHGHGDGDGPDGGH